MCGRCQTLREALKRPVKFARLLARDTAWSIQAKAIKTRRLIRKVFQ